MDISCVLQIYAIKLGLMQLNLVNNEDGVVSG